MSQSGYLFLGLTAIVAGFSAVLAYAVLRIFAAARAATRDERKTGTQTAFMTSAMEDAVRKLRDGERAMKARAEASERLSGEIVASLTSGLLVVDGDGIVRTLNPAGQTMLGLPGNRWEGPYREVLKDVGPLADVLEECLRTSRPVVRRAVPLTGGVASHLGLTVSPIREGAGGTAHGVICLFSDLTEVMELEEQLRLKDSLARLGEMTAGIAHEFRNGLATIHGYGRLLDLERLPRRLRPYVQGIRDETEALGQVVTNFLDFARPTELALAPVEMAALVERAAEEVRAEVRARGGDVDRSRRVRPGRRRRGPASSGAQQPLSQRVRGLRPGANRRRRSSSRASVTRSHGIQRISVSDNGPGVPANVVDQRLPAVLHDQGAGHRPRPRPRPEDHRHPQRPRDGRQPRRRRRAHSSSRCRSRCHRRASDPTRDLTRLQISAFASRRCAYARELFEFRVIRLTASRCRFLRFDAAGRAQFQQRAIRPSHASARFSNKTVESSDRSRRIASCTAVARHVPHPTTVALVRLHPRRGPDRRRDIHHDRGRRRSAHCRRRRARSARPGSTRRPSSSRRPRWISCVARVDVRAVGARRAGRPAIRSRDRREPSEPCRRTARDCRRHRPERSARTCRRMSTTWTMRAVGSVTTPTRRQTRCSSGDGRCGRCPPTPSARWCCRCS